MHTFESYTWQHFIPVLFFLIAGVLTVYIGRRSTEKRQRVIGVLIAVTVLLAMLGGSVIKLATGVYDIRHDLPLYLCRLIAWVLPLIIWKHQRYWLGICYFWILAGTFQGILTPDLAEGFPNYFYFRYWFLHAGLVLAILYAVLVFRVRIDWKDFWRALLMTQFYIVLIHVVNLLLHSNYSYTVQKPPGTSILDLFGKWPWYVLGGEVLILVFYLLLMLPWVVSRR